MLHTSGFTEAGFHCKRNPVRLCDQKNFGSEKVRWKQALSEVKDSSYSRRTCTLPLRGRIAHSEKFRSALTHREHRESLLDTAPSRSLSHRALLLGHDTSPFRRQARDWRVVFPN